MRFHFRKQAFRQCGGTIAFHGLVLNLKVKETYKMMAKFKFVDVVKWLATVIQLFGYGMTGLNLIPYNNIYIFHWDIFMVCRRFHVER